MMSEPWMYLLISINYDDGHNLFPMLMQSRTDKFLGECYYVLFAYQYVEILLMA